MTSGAHLVVGPGDEAIRVAATLAAAGDRVTLVRTEPALPPSLSCAEGATWARVPGADGASARVHGPTKSVPYPRTGIHVSGVTRTLPLEPTSFGSILPSGRRRATARSFVRARARNALATIVGGGQEERTYRDWVVRRMGEPAYSLMYADYAERRWGRPGDALSASLARVVHSPALAGERVCPEDPRDHSSERAQALLSGCGVDIIDSGLRRLHVEGRRITTVELDSTFVDASDKTIWTTLSADRVATALGPDCPATARHLAATLGTMASGRVRLSGATSDAPDELHILDPAPCWRFVRAPDNPAHWLVSTTGPLSSAVLEDIRDFARQAGLVGAASAVEASASLPGGAPAWGPVDHARLRTVLESWGPLGLLSTGSAGTLTPLDPTSLVAHVELLRTEGAGSMQEAWRTIAAPPTRVDDLHAQMSHFFAGT